MSANPLPVEHLRGRYALRHDSMLAAVMQAMQRHPGGTISDADLRTRLSGILRGLIAFTLRPASDFHVVADLGYVLHGLCDGSHAALADLHLTLFDLLTDDVADDFPDLRPAVQHMLVNLDHGWFARTLHAEADIGVSLSAEATTDPYRQMVLQSPAGMFLIDTSMGEVVEYGPAMEALFGYSLAEEAELPPEAFVTDETPEDDFDLLNDMLEGRIPYLERQTVRRHRDGSSVPFDMLAWPIRNETGDITYLGHLLTPTSLREPTPAERTMRDTRIRYLAQLSSDPILVLSAERSIQYASPSVERSLGFVPANLIGTAVDDLVPDADRAGLIDLVADVLTAPRRRATAEIRLARSDGEMRWFELVAANLTDVDEVQGIGLQGRDISDRKLLEERLAHQAMVDPLTQALNRRGFVEVLDRTLAELGAGQVLCVAYLDLDDFKGINDHYGHIVGDTLLVELADRIGRVIGERGKVGRMGGDEFVFCVRASSVAELDDVERDILASFEQHHIVHGEPLQVNGTIGRVDHVGGNAVTSQELILRADQDLYQRKRRGRSAEMVRRGV